MLKRAFVSLTLVAFVAGGASAVTRPHYTFSMSTPPRLSVYNGDIYGIPDKELQNQVGTGQWRTHTSTPVAGTSSFLNTDKEFKLSHRYYWILTGQPVRYAVDKTFKLTHVTGYTKTSKEEFEKNLGMTAGGKLFDVIDVGVSASLKLTTTETEEWHEEQTVETDQTYKAHYIYCTWSLIDELTSTVTTRASTDPKDQPASGKPTITNATFRNIIRTYEDDAPDPVAKLLTAAVASFSRAPGKLSVGSPVQVQ